MTRIQQANLQHALDAYIDTHISTYYTLGQSALVSTVSQAIDQQQLLQFPWQQFQKRHYQPQLLHTPQPLLLAEKSATGNTKRTLLFYHQIGTRTQQNQTFLPFLVSLLASDAYLTITDNQDTLGLLWLLDSGTATSMSPGPLDSTVQQAIQADYYICHQNMESEIPLLALGLKGYLKVSLTVQTTTQAIPSSAGAIAPNAAWRLLWALQSLKDKREEILIEGFYDSIIPFDDDITSLLRLLPDTSQSLAASWQLPQLLLGLHDFQFHYTHLLTPTCNIITLQSTPDEKILSFEHTVLPAKAQAILDFHLVPGQDPYTIFRLLQQHLHRHGFTDIHLHLQAASYPAHIPTTHPLSLYMQQATFDAYGQAPYLIPMLPEHLPLLQLQSPPQPELILYSLPPLLLNASDPTVEKIALSRAIKQLAFLLAAIHYAS